MEDFLFEMTSWLRTTRLLDFSFALQDGAVSRMLVGNFWVVPTVQVIHLLAIGTAFAAMLMQVLRMNGLSGDGLTMRQVANRFSPWVWWGVAVIALSGVGMIAAEPVRNLVNAVFWVKMALLALALGASFYLQRASLSRSLGHAGRWTAGSGLRFVSIMAIVLWICVMTAGRWIAYAPT
ncbi:DUF6644 family protein [Aurantiacibacter spongiae]|uniref:DUF6644 domain-containing protein n=1 Tax=Aurantiacibacter spongiae TaxID=2488860 RepID=A0A3N5DJL7_9SPHN|nr:DUF6644 family protein [Aurantiacibacter spongiae]RPF70915.1 hypothetical protein EG799_04235 [Aurantiacibacter spongiae]